MVEADLKSHEGLSAEYSMITRDGAYPRADGVASNSIYHQPDCWKTSKSVDAIPQPLAVRITMSCRCMWLPF